VPFEEEARWVVAHHDTTTKLSWNPFDIFLVREWGIKYQVELKCHSLEYGALVDYILHDSLV